MNIPFVKMHGNGNDFIIIDNRKLNLSLPKRMIAKLSSRNLGIGCDQFILLESSNKYDIFMRIYNCNGEEVEMCCNAARCVASLLFASKKKNKLKIETVSKILDASLIKDNKVCIDIKLPSQNKKYFSLSKTLRSNVVDFSALHPFFKKGILINMGNPHIVFIIPSFKNFDVSLYGKKVETNGLFKNNINVEFVEILTKNKIKVKFWERGAGRTLSCGSGALAAVLACHIEKKCKSEVNIDLPIGNVKVFIKEKILSIIGKADVSFLGEFLYDK